MRILIQRVKSGKVIINDQQYSSIKQGLLCFVGFCDSDNTVDFEWAINKIRTLKLFNNQMSLEELEGELLIISQFTLFASIKKGSKPSWSKAAKPEVAKQLYNEFVEICKNQILERVQTGVFGADMQIELINDGPVTLILDTKKRE